MAITETTYTALTGPQAMYRFLVDMVAQGWAVAISSDGTTYNGSGNQITSDGSGAGGLDNTDAYYVLRRSGAPDWLVHNAGSDNWNILFSTSGAFSGGSASVRSTAPDEVYAWSEFATLFYGAYDVEIHVEDATPYRWALRTAESIYLSSIGATTRPIALFNAFFAGGSFTTPSAFSDQDAWEDVEAMLYATEGGGGGPIDTAPPVINSWSPTPSSSIARADLVAVDVTDETALGPVTISAELADGTVLTVYQDGAFVGLFAAGSSQSGDTWTIEHDAPGWPSSSVDIHVLAVDAAGNTATATASFTVTDPPAPPSFGSFSPAAGSITRATNVDFTVTSPEDFEKIVVWAVLGDGSTVMVYTGAAFGPEVDAASSVSGTTTRSFSVTHDGAGWPDDYTLHVLAVDSRGVSATASSAYTLTDPPAAPVVGNFSPTDGDTTTRTGTITIDVTDDEGRTAIALVSISATLSDGSVRTVYNGAGFEADFSASSRSDITDGYRYTIAHASPGWPSETLAFRVVAMDTQGRVTTSTSYNLTVSDPPEPVVPDTTPPQVTNITPANGATIARAAAVEFDVTDDTGLAAVIVMVLYPDTGDYEVAHDGTTFAPRFVSKSTRTAISGGYRFKLVRTGGWPSAPTVRVKPIDTAANEG